jgi:hypothetical protein
MRADRSAAFSPYVLEVIPLARSTSVREIDARSCCRSRWRLGLDYLRQLDPCAMVLAEPEVPGGVDEHVTAFAFSGVVNGTWLEPQVGYG